MLMVTFMEKVLRKMYGKLKSLINRQPYRVQSLALIKYWKQNGENSDQIDGEADLEG